MAVEQVNLELIDDNPYQTRLTYHKQSINELAASIKAHGLLQVPPARRKDGRVELGFGHLRKRAFQNLAKGDAAAWGKMPLEIREIADDQMVLFALEENLKRSDITPIEVARAVDFYLLKFTEKTEVDLAKQLNMTQGNISNMRRVLQLPAKILEKIDQGRISFTQGRELIVLEKLENSEELMLSAIRGVRTGDQSYGHANTVEGMQTSIHDMISSRCRPLDKEYQGYRWDLIFDTRAANCLQCEKMIRTHPTKSATAHYCLDVECWDRHQEEQRQKVSAEAKAKMEADIIRRAAEQVEVPKEAHIYRIQNQVTKEWWDGLAASPEAALAKAGWNKEDCWIRVKTERGGWGKVSISQEIPAELSEKDETDKWMEEQAAALEERVDTKDRELEAEKDAAEAEQEAIPEDILTLAREKAGTRAEVLDLKDIGAGYYQEVKQGYALLDGFGRPLDHIADPDECLKRCTHGFHYAFDSRDREPRTRYVCSDTKCLTQKKAAFTRAKNAEGQASKKAEVKAIKEAIAQTTTLDRPRIKLILLAQINGLHASRTYYYGGEGKVKNPETWLWEKLSAGTPTSERKLEDLFKRIDKLSDGELAKLVVEFMFYYITDKGDIGAYEIKATEPLKWMGIEVKVDGGTEDNGNH